VDAEDEVRRFIVESLGRPAPQPLPADYPLIEGDVLDSMGIFELVTFLEGRFDIIIDDEELVPDNFASVAAIARLVAAKTP
jgi:acyl carrier protein